MVCYNEGCLHFQSCERLAARVEACVRIQETILCRGLKVLKETETAIFSVITSDAMLNFLF